MRINTALQISPEEVNVRISGKCFKNHIWILFTIRWVSANDGKRRNKSDHFCNYSLSHSRLLFIQIDYSTNRVHISIIKSDLLLEVSSSWRNKSWSDKLKINKKLSQLISNSKSIIHTAELQSQHSQIFCTMKRATNILDSPVPPSMLTLSTLSDSLTLRTWTVNDNRMYTSVIRTGNRNCQSCLFDVNPAWYM